MLKDRIRNAVHVLRGRPLITGVEFHGGIFIEQKPHIRIVNVVVGTRDEG